MTIDEAIQRENNFAEENQKIVDTQIVFDDVSLSQLYCDDTEVIEEHLENYKKCAEYHKKIAEWLEELKAMKEMDLDIPQHFTKEQSDWIKAYCIGRNVEFYNKAIHDAIKIVKENYRMEALERLEKIKAGVKKIVQEVEEEFATDTNVGTNGWIPCSEMLPEEYGDYLVWWTDITCGQYYEIVEYEPNNGWIGDIPQSFEGKYSVIAWQPLPEPYKES